MSDLIKARKGIFIPDITVEMFRNASLEAVEELLVSGEMQDIILPSAEPEIIRCKDCKHIQKWRSEESAKKFGQIYECARSVFGCPKPEDFCSWAELRGEQE